MASPELTGLVDSTLPADKAAICRSAWVWRHHKRRPFDEWFKDVAGEPQRCLAITLTDPDSDGFIPS
jgi:hypothetical protein